MGQLGKKAVHILCACVIASCASAPASHTEVIGTWKADNYDKKLSKFLIISLSDEFGIREKVESTVVTKLKNEGLHATASSQIMPLDEEISRETVKKAIKGKDLDAVLVSRLLSMEQSAKFVPPTANVTFDNTFDMLIPNPPAAARVEHQSVTAVQIDLFDVASGHLVWSMKVHTVDYDNVTQLVNNLTDIVVGDLRSKGLI